MARAVHVSLLGLLVLSAVFVIGLGCSRDNPTGSDPSGLNSLAQTVNLQADGLVDYADGYPFGVWQDGFEDYTVGTWPSTWVPSGNAPGLLNCVVDDIAFEGNQSLRLYGIPFGAWAGCAYRALETQAPLEIRVAVYNGNEPIGGTVQPARGHIGLLAGPHWSYPWRTLIQFNQDNDIISSGGHVLGTYNCLEWYEVRIRYERYDEENVRIRYWINHQFVWVEILPVRTGEDDYSYITLEALEGSAWFDNVEVCTRP